MYGRERGINCGRVREEGFVADYKCDYIRKDMKRFFWNVEVGDIMRVKGTKM